MAIPSKPYIQNPKLLAEQRLVESMGFSYDRFMNDVNYLIYNGVVVDKFKSGDFVKSCYRYLVKLRVNKWQKIKS